MTKRLRTTMWFTTLTTSRVKATRTTKISTLFVAAQKQTLNVPSGHTEMILANALWKSRLNYTMHTLNFRSKTV